MPAELFSENKQKDAIKENAIQLEEVEELRTPIKNILDQLRSEIDSGTYKIILGDDASGRIPTIIFGNVLSSIYLEKDSKVPQIRFIPAHPEIPKQPLDNEVKKISRKMEMSGKVLIVTDTILFGGHLRPVAEALKNNNLKFDIASIGIEGGAPRNKVEDLEKEWDCKIAWGMEGTPSIYYNKSLSGVFKEDRDTISRSRKRREMRYGIANYKARKEQKDINMARQDADELSRQIYEWYRLKHES